MNRKLVPWIGALVVASLANGCDSASTPSVPPSTVTGTPEVPVIPEVLVTPRVARPPQISGGKPAVNTAPNVLSSKWERRQLGDMPPGWQSRDGAQMVQLGTGRILMIGGWSPLDPWGPLGDQGPDGGGDRITNEVWKSDDLGETWSLLLPHNRTPPETGPNARFLPGHTVGVVTYNGHAVLIGTDPLTEDGVFYGDVWHESNNGQTWTRVSMTAPTADRTLFMCGNYNGAIYVMGGQRTLYDAASALNDVWRSVDGGIRWTRLADAPWTPRGLVYRPIEHNGKLVIVGGGRYSGDVSVALNGVFAFDGTSWQTVLPDGHSQFTATFYNPVTSLSGRLWLFNGYDPKQDIELSRAMVSDDNGATWGEFPGGSGGPESHADALVTTGDRILRVSGQIGERAIWEFVP